MGAVAAPDLCAGGLMHNREGATFNVVVGSTAHTGAINFQWHYRVPAAKNKPNTNCTNAADVRPVAVRVGGVGAVVVRLVLRGGDAVVPLEVDRPGVGGRADDDVERRALAVVHQPARAEVG